MSTIGKGIVVTGTIEAEESVSIAGTVKGEILATGHDLTLEQGGRIDGNATARTINLKGTFVGTHHRAPERADSQDGLGQGRHRRPVDCHGRRRGIQRDGRAGPGRSRAACRGLSPQGVTYRASVQGRRPIQRCVMAAVEALERPHESPRRKPNRTRGELEEPGYASSTASSGRWSEAAGAAACVTTSHEATRDAPAAGTNR